MVIVTIPKKITKGEELVVIPRKEYERVLRIFKKERKTRTQFDRDLEKALKDAKAGRLFGPFKSVKEFKNGIGD